MTTRMSFSKDLLTPDEIQVVLKVTQHMKSSRMTLQDKLCSARLIARQELELGHYSSRREQEKIRHFAKTLDSIIDKLRKDPSSTSGQNHELLSPDLSLRDFLFFNESK